METTFKKKRFVRTLPLNVTQVDVPYFQNLSSYDCPDLKLYHFKSINLLPDSTLFKGISPVDISFIFFKKRIRLHNRKGILSIRLRWKKVKLKSENSFLVIHDPWTKNYYHWITQALPRLLLAQQTNKTFVLLLPADHQTEFHLATLRLLRVESWQTLETGERYYNIQNLLYTTRDIQIGDYNDDLIRLLSKKLSIPQTNLGSRKRLFVQRASRERRRIINEQDVFDTFLSFGFEMVVFEGLSIAEQISLLSNVNILAGVHGAGLTNMMFMPRESVVFELTTKLDGENYYFYALSSALSNHYYYQLCEADQENTVQEANLIVDIDTLKKNLSLMLS